MEPLTFLVLHYCKSALQLHVCVCSRWGRECQNSCQSPRQNAQRNDVNDSALVKMWSPSDNSAELKGQSCHSRGEHKAEWSSVVEGSVRGCWSSQIQNSTSAAQVSHIVSIYLWKVFIPLESFHVLLFYNTESKWLFCGHWSTNKKTLNVKVKIDLYNRDPKFMFA